MATNITPDSLTTTQPINNEDGCLTVNSDQLRDDEQREWVILQSNCLVQEKKLISV